MLRSFSLLLLAAIAGVAMGLIGIPTLGGHQLTALPILAQACNHAANPICSGGMDLTRTSAMTVRYADGSASSVIPNGATNWSITAHWFPAVGSNCTTSQTATCTVTWNGTTWSLSNVAGTADIVGIALCDTSMCDYEAAVGYKLIVNINDPGPTGFNLDNVDYVTTSVPNGTVCGGSGTTPVSQTNSGNQFISTSNSNNCPFTCSVSGPTMTITYN